MTDATRGDELAAEEDVVRDVAKFPRPFPTTQLVFRCGQLLFRLVWSESDEHGLRGFAGIDAGTWEGLHGGLFDGFVLPDDYVGLGGHGDSVARHAGRLGQSR